MICNKCGAQNPDGARACMRCGAMLANGAPQNFNQGYNTYPQNQQMNNIAPEPGRGLAIASLVLGIVSFFCVGVIAGIVAIIFGAMAKNQGNKSGMATAGIVLGIIGFVLSIFGLIILL